MTRCIPCTPKVPSASFSVVLLAGLYAVSWMPGSLVAQAPGANGLTYRLNETWIEGGGGSTTLQVHQAGDAAVARYESGERIALVSNQTAGIVSARPDRYLPILIEIVDVLESLGPGSEMISDEEVTVIESITFNLERGDSDRTLEGYQAEHRVLTIDLKLQQVGPDGRRGNEITATGRADLWTAPDLPFSWLPYTSPNYYVWALPLSFSYPQVAANVLVELSNELSGLGLLLRAEIQSSIATRDVGFEYNQELVREIKVEGLEEAAGPLDMTPFNQLVLALSSYKSLMGGLILAGEFCTREVPAGTSSLTLKINKTREISGEGVARVDSEVLVLGSLDPSSTEQGPGCITIVTEPAGPEPGEYALAVGSEGWDPAPTPKALAYYLRGTEESPQVTLIEAGTLNFESAGSGKLQAELRGTGWTANLTPSSASLIKDVAFELFFELDAPSAEQTSAGAPDTEASLADAVAVPADVEPWSPLTFNPALNEPVAEWTFGGGVSRGVTLDSRGRYAAVALVSEPKIVLLDLESRSQLGEIDVERDAGGKHVSSLAFGPSGSTLAIGLPMGRVRIVDMTTRETLQELQYSKDGRSSSVASLKFDPAGSRVLGSTNGEIVAWDIDGGEVLSTWGAGRITDLAFTPDGTRVAAVVSGSVKIWDSQTASEICELPGDFLRFTMHPAGDRLAVWSFEQKVVVASTSDCSEIAAWPTTPSFVPSIAWAADGEHLILGSGDGPLYVYTEQGESAGVWSGPSEGSFVFTSSGSNRVLSTDLSRSEESKVILWENE